ncbi:tRNA (guanosine(37)-N1)-methyltransferase TrmD [Pectinatus haikarae]|uniref:tRNA (guanine-N(1)-)-methyltransferase n=1 Tax=Pectinatus haikarae TaxID=349096 RepID=A0ABT9Y8N7_9FIRM|nr:tRNA (guanosine(37)-N1)-methyltransferase TrmD [Pectinatus haikarae]MDQ0204203.1 tRNA (guanine37-N1)-methyltransferase [Pectinatus haikarae]
MKIDIVTLFPEMFHGPFGHSIIKRAADKNIIDIFFTNPRDFTYDKHHQVDDAPFGGGAGMVLKPEPFFRSVANIKNAIPPKFTSRVLLMCPGGQTFSQEKARQLSQYDSLIFICGHYEGFDNRITEKLADEIISIGDYVLTGGELACMVIVDAVSRMLPGVLGSKESASTDSFYNGLLEHPQYTRPREYKKMPVPDILFSGDHSKIALWRKSKALEETFSKRPDLLADYPLTKDEIALLEKMKK